MAEGDPDRKDSDRKERVIHTRVAEDLDDEIKRRAQHLGLSVSNLVRNILQNTIGLVEEIVQDGAEAVQAARRAAHARPAATPQPTVLGWQPAVLAVNAVCERCNALLPRGVRAAIGVLSAPGTPPFRCEPCVEEIRADDEPRTPGQ
jgi:hypothetical protein